MTSQRWRVRPEGSTWGDFGADDQLGRLNLLTPERVRRAAAEIRTGRRFCLSLPLDYPGGRVLSRFRGAPCLCAINPDGTPRFNYRSDSRATDIESDDVVRLATQYSTHWDSFAHIGQMFDADGDGAPEPLYYNGFRPGEHVTVPDGVEGSGRGAGKLGIETIAESCVQGRGVMIDLHHHLRHKTGPLAVEFDGVRRVMDADGVTVEEGDIVCFNTGFSDALLGMNRHPDADALARRTIALDGRDRPLLDWISASGIAAIVADNFAVEAFPAKAAVDHPAAALPLHEHCLFKLGVPLGELWHLGDLARWLRDAGRSRFFLTAPPLRLPGAVGSPVTPVATV